MNLFVMMECKIKIKIVVLGHFAECCTRQRTPLPSAMATALGKARKMGVQKTIFPALPNAVTMALGKEFFLKKKSNFAECQPEGTRQRNLKKFKLCQVSARGHSAKNFFKKKFKLCRVPARGHSAKIFLKKKLKLFADHRPVGTRQRIFFKKIKNLCRVPVGLALGKATVNGTGAVTAAFLCRVPDKRHSAKRVLPINFLPCALCRVPHSAKNLNPVVMELWERELELLLFVCQLFSSRCNTLDTIES